MFGSFSTRIYKQPSNRALVGLLLAVALLAPVSQADTPSLKELANIGGELGNLAKGEERQMLEWRGAVQQMDAQSQVAPEGSYYAERLDDLTRDVRIVNGMPMTYRVYISPQANAFAVGTGDVRIYSGLMDILNDDELMFVIGHEIGHVIEKHGRAGSKRSALIKLGSVLTKRKATSDQQQKTYEVGALLGDKAFGRAQEKEADMFGLALLDQAELPLYAGVTAMHRLAEASGTSSNPVMQLLATHPDPLRRAKIIKSKIPKSQLPQEEKVQGMTLKKYK